MKALGLPPLATTTRTSVTDEVVKRLVSLILEEGLRPGNKLPSERELIKRLGVGRSSLREAISRLSAIGVVDVLAGKGIFVGRGEASVPTQPLSWGLLMSESTALEVIEARRTIEVDLAGLAAERATEDDISAIGQRLALILSSLDDMQAHAYADLEFHLAVGRAGHNRVLYHVMETLQHMVRVWILAVVANQENRSAWMREHSVNEHVRVYEAIRAHDVQAARSAMATKLDTAAARLRSILNRMHPKEQGS